MNVVISIDPNEPTKMGWPIRWGFCPFSIKPEKEELKIASDELDLTLNTCLAWDFETEEWTFNLNRYKTIRYTEFKDNNERLKQLGFPYGSYRLQTWPAEAKADWIGFGTMVQYLPPEAWPYPVPTMEPGVMYLIQDELEFSAIYGALFEYCSWIVASGDVLASQVRAATTKSAVDDVIDHRLNGEE